MGVKSQKRNTETKVLKNWGDREAHTDRDREKESEDLPFDVWEVSHSIRDP